MNINSMLNSIKKANHMLTETLILHYYTKTVCSGCGIDPVNKEAINYNCPVCGGTGYSIEDKMIDIPVSFEYLSSDNKLNSEVNRLKPGVYDDSVILITIDKEEMDEYNIDIDKVDCYEWNNTKYRIISKEPGVLGGTIYEINLMLEKII